VCRFKVKLHCEIYSLGSFDLRFLTNLFLLGESLFSFQIIISFKSPRTNCVVLVVVVVHMLCPPISILVGGVKIQTEGLIKVDEPLNRIRVRTDG
jgi:hypothetical protein